MPMHASCFVITFVWCGAMTGISLRIECQQMQLAKGTVLITRNKACPIINAEMVNSNAQQSHDMRLGAAL